MRFWPGLLLFYTALNLPADAVLSLKVFPAEARLENGGTPIRPFSQSGAVRKYRLPAGRQLLMLTAEKYHPKRLHLDLTADLYIEEKLERSGSRMVLAGEIGTGPAPKSVAFSPDGRCLVVPLLNGGGVDLLSYDPASAEIVSRARELRLLPAGRNSGGFVETAVLASRNEIWVTQMHGNLVHILDASSGALKASLESGGTWPKVIAFSADEKHAFVSNWESRDVSVITVAERRLERLIKVSGTPRGLAVGPDGRHLYVCIFETGEVEKIDLHTWKSAGRLGFGPGAARHIVIHPPSRRAYVSDMARGRIIVFSLEDDRPLGSVWVGPNLNSIVLSPAGDLLFVSMRGRNDPLDYTRKGPEFGRVGVLDTRSLEMIDWTWGRNQPTGLALSPDGRYLVFTDFLDDNLEVYDVSGLRG